MAAQAMVLEFGMGVDVHGEEGTKAACRAVSDAIRHSSLPLFTEVRAKGGRMLVDVTVGVPDPGKVDVERVKKELPHGEVTVRPVPGGLRVPVSPADGRPARMRSPSRGAPASSSRGARRFRPRRSK